MTLLSSNYSSSDLVEHCTTETAAKELNRKPQTLRKWACLESGPIRPIRINGRLAWRVTDIVALQRGEVV